HTELIRMFAGQGIATIVCDKSPRERFDPALIGEFESLGVELRLGEDYLARADMDVFFRTPGMYFNMPRLRGLRDAGVAVTGEMEVFFDLCPCATIAVTGSDGKTTTTTLIAEMLKAAGRTVHLGGNIGRALLPIVDTIKPDDCAVAELSSFQLISMRRSPDIAVLTNITPNHLDVHGTMEEYAAAKQNIYRHQNAFGITILNADDGLTRSFADEVRGSLRLFSMKEEVSGAWLRGDGMLMYGKRELFPKSDIRLPGEHNAANYLAAIAAVEHLVPLKAMHRVAKEFGGVEHRIELVREINKIRWYNDSIATSPTRSIAGLRSFGQKIIMIAGGYDKQIPYEPLAPELIAHVKLLILTGATAPKIEEALIRHAGYSGSPRIIHAENLEEAVKAAHENSEAGDVVTLSPASASFDMYKNFEERGRHFKELVGGLQ
ncbi:MAG: UDP-N-acetylmuramoyl-L-alanine--D-glutamate ligase, partial [Oscillospiraceae bacterium]|nr:UDP-N-acetylmuramoyl-L-alanine--D-glutamate ligase [Oscillospiraceae bacterium]